MARLALLFVLPLAVLAPPVGYAATQCDQGPTVNPVILGCAPGVDPCVVLDHDIPAGCDLDFGDRAVVFAGTLDVGTAALTVRAARITVDGQLHARADDDLRGGAVTLTALAICAPPDDDGAIIVRGTIDASGNPGGRVTLAATCHVDLASGSRVFSKGRLGTSPNFASGGIVSALAGTALLDEGDLDVHGGSGGGGGQVILRAGTDLIVDHPIDATGGERDGGAIDLLAGDHLTLLRTLDVRSRGGGGGGTITALAGVDLQGGVVPGGDLLLDGDLLADGDGEADAGFDGGFLTLSAVGTVELTPAARILASGGSPDGFGGVVTISSGDLVPTRIGALDGDVVLNGTLNLRAPGDGIGGELEITAGRDAILSSTMDLSGGFGGGEIAVLAGRHTTYDGDLDVSGRGNEGTGGAIEMRTGFADIGTTHILSSMDASANSDDADADVLLAGCHLVVEPNVTIDGRTSAPDGGGVIDLIGRYSITLGTASRYLATPAGPITLVHPPGIVPLLDGAVFDPPVTIETDDPGLIPPCPDCGDGVRDPGEICDPGPEADGACCSADCSTFLCPTPTSTPTPITTPTGPTPTATVTVTATSTITPTPGTPSPSTTPTPLAPEPKTALRCAQTLAKASTSFVLADLKALEQCATRAFRCIQGAPPGDARAACLDGAARRCRSRVDKLIVARTRFNALLAKSCGGTPPVVPLAVMRDPDVLAFAILEPTCQAETGLSLTSHGAIAACVQLGGACAVEQSLGTAMPRLADALGLLFPLEGLPFCIPEPLGNDLGLDGNAARDAARCQRTLLSSGRKLLRRQIAVAGRCVTKLLACRLADASSPCARATEQCARKLAALADPTRGTRAKLVSAAERSCRALDLPALRATNGLGFDGAVAPCSALGEGPLESIGAIAGCVARSYECAGNAIARHALPLVDSELARVALALPSCP